MEVETDDREFCADALRTLFDNMKEEVDMDVFMEVCLALSFTYMVQFANMDSIHAMLNDIQQRFGEELEQEAKPTCH
tara:strand:+ start:43 stop:273 length:231 start_codon:yes stop_codon:yes gene_type:complete